METNYYITKSGTSYIDAVLGNAKWQAPLGQSATLTYSINSPASQSVYNGEASEASSMAAFRSYEAAAIPLALLEWSKVANISFQKKGELEQADIRIAKSAEVDGTGSAAWAYTPDNGSSVAGQPTLTPNAAAGDIWLSTEDELRADKGDYYFQTLLHEMGHAIGLKHSFEGDDVLGSQDNYQYSVMSYTDHPSAAFIRGPEANSLYPLAASTPMLYDIAAIQYLYGSNNSYNNGDTTYRYDDSAVLMTLWDGGGNDRLDFSALSDGVSINLAEGSYSSFGQALDSSGKSMSLTNNFAIAFNAEIENVTGSRHADELIGNDLNNRFSGGGGGDTIDGISGNDVVDIDANFNELKFDLSNSQSARITVSGDTIILKNIDAVAIGGGYINLSDFNVSQQRVATEDQIMSVARLYQAALDRKPDVAGLNYWVDEYERGFSLQNISQSFVDAEEFNNLFNVASGQGFIATLYENVLNRAPDQAGLDYWLADIGNGQRYQDILVSFSESDENISNTASLDDSLNYDVGAGLWLV